MVKETNETPTVPRAADEPLPELATFLQPFATLFHYRPSWHSVERYLTGLLTDLPRKNCQTIAAAVAGTSTERLQHLLTDAAWDPQSLDRMRVQVLSAQSPAGGILVLDDTGLPKQGQASAGVEHQYSGTLGKQGNCQIVVSAEYVADAPTTQAPLHWPVTAQLYLPQVWAGDPPRRHRAHVPDELAFAPKTALALTLLDRALAWGVPFRVVVADAGYGDAPSFLEALEQRRVPYVCAVDKTFGVRLPDELRAAAAPAPAAPLTERRGRGQPKKPRPAPRHMAAAVLAALPEDAWQTVQWREGAKGVLQKQVVAVRAHWATGSPRHSATHGRVSTGPEGWLLGERPLPGHGGEPKYYFSSLPADTSLPLRRLVELAHARWTIEQFYEDAKGECGLDEYQGRRWDGLHRHLALVMLAYSFLAIQSLAPRATTGAGGDPSPLSTFRACPDAACRPSSCPGLALPGPGPVAAPDRPDQDLPSPENLTK
jgi:SRSO17 transposase